MLKGTKKNCIIFLLKKEFSENRFKNLSRETIRVECLGKLPGNSKYLVEYFREAFHQQKSRYFSPFKKNNSVCNQSKIALILVYISQYHFRKILALKNIKR